MKRKKVKIIRATEGLEIRIYIGENFQINNGKGVRML